MRRGVPRPSFRPRALSAPHAPRARRAPFVLLALLALMMAACQPDASPSVTTSPPATLPTGGLPTPSTGTPAPSQSESAAPSSSPSPTPEPSLSLAIPDDRDERVVAAEVTSDVPADAGGTITVTVTSQADERINELVLRWPTELGETLFLAPFVPSDERIRDGGPPLHQEWTKWVVGPGERGEPEGTTSLGYGPLMPGATLTIPLYVTRNAPGPVAFDLQLLSGNDLLNLTDGDPAELRLEVP